jgi:hypothetical protein
MRARVLLAATFALAAGLCLWIFYGLAGGPVSVPDATVALAPLAEPPAAATPATAAENPPLPAVSADEAEAAAATRAKILGIPAPPPDALVAVRGRVVDAVTKEPVQGIALGFLSRRPRTCTVHTDAQGRFATGVELASGVVSVTHLPDPESAEFSARWSIEPTSFLAAAAAAGETTGSPGADDRREVVLLARPPARELAIDVRLPDGGAAVGASVSLTYGKRDATGRFLPDGRAYEDADDYGRARFALFGSDTWERSFRIEAEHRGSLASDVLSLDPPLGARAPVLELHPGGALRVRASNDEGRPVSGVSLWIETQDEPGLVRGRAGETDASGEFVFSALRSGCYTLSAVHPATGEEVRREIDLPRAAQETADLRLTLAGLKLRAAGTVVDETGFPLQGVVVRAQAAGEAPVALSTGEGGRFEFWGRPCEGLLVTAGGGFQDDRYEPEIQAVPCGSQNLAVRRVAKLEDCAWPFEATDRATGEPVRAAVVTLFHGDPRRGPIAQQSFTAAAGVVSVSFKRREDLSFAVDAPGYLREEGPLANLLADASRRGALRVDLDRGFDRTLEVRDRVTRRGIGGAILSAGATALGRTDEHGSVRIRADAWPASVRVEGQGYAPVAWDPATAGYPGDVVWLEPLRAGN